MIVWGGAAGSNLGPSADGAAYDPATDSWRAISPAPLEPRFGHTAFWTGELMYIWGGTRGEDDPPFNNGAAYDPVTDQWEPVFTAPMAGRFFHSAVWTGTEALVWGGRIQGTEDIGIAFKPVDNTWREFAAGPLGAREGHSAIWTGDSMIIWAGVLARSESLANDGARYELVTDTWTALPEPPLPGRYGHAAAWTGRDMYVWGGTDGSRYALPDGALYDPLGDAWAPLEPFPLVGRFGHSAVWTGVELIIWGGRNGQDLKPVARGAAYDPIAVQWRGEIDASGRDVSAPDAAHNEAPPPPAGFAFVECGRLAVPRNAGEVNTNLDFENGLLELSLVMNGHDTNIMVSFFHPACLAHPFVGPIIELELKETIEGLETECADWRLRLDAGPVIVGEQLLDPNSVRAFIDRWCS